MEPDPEPLSGATVLFATFTPSELILKAALILFLLFCSGLITACQAAFSSLSEGDLQRLQQEPDAGSRRLLRLREEPQVLFFALQISNNLANIAIIILAELLLLKWASPGFFQTWMAPIPESLQSQAAPPFMMDSLLNLVLIVTGIVVGLVLFGEVAPRVYSSPANSLRLSRAMSGPLLALTWLLSPISRLMIRWSSLSEEFLDSQARSGSQASREDIDEAIEIAVSRGDTESEPELDILKSLVKFGDVTVKQIMCSRLDVVAVNIRIDFRELLEVVRESGYSRIPVYEEDFDNVAGILYVKDLLGHLHENPGFNWQELIRKNVLYVPEAKKINDLLKEFQRQHLHMAIVVDEYGGSSGIVTLEDIMEEVIGEIKDEFDDEAEVIFKKIDDYNYLFEGKTLLNDVCRIIGVDTTTFDRARGDADSLAGLILELCGQLPKKDAEIPYNVYRFKPVSVSKRRIEQVLVTLPRQES